MVQTNCILPQQITTSKQIPVHALIITVVISWLLAIIRVGSAIAMNDIVSMAISGIYCSYLIVAVLLFIRRVRGDISRLDNSDTQTINVPGAKLVWGPFYCPGLLGTIINAYAIVYILIIVFFSFWPVVMNPTVEVMNWSILAIGGTMFFALVYYVLRARHVYTGPIIEVSH